ncbi:hypothetical protein [Flagellimonas marina]|uniref:Lipoprotein n=1 Tax=Flagellimonas marina TaxID=1775168 RepID=A0ABV8PLC9_9FLAO
MKSIIRILLLISIVTTYSCTEKARKKERNVPILTNQIDDDSCLERRDVEIITKKILSTDDLQLYLKPLKEKGLGVQILRNEFLTDALNVTINGQKVVFIDSLKSTERVFKLTFPKIDCEAKKVSFAIWYEFEHADITGNAINQNNEWNVEVVGHGIVD